MKNTYFKIITSAILTIFCVNYVAIAQHSNEFVIDGAAVYVTANANIYIMGDVQLQQGTATLVNNGFMEVQGNWSTDALAQQRGTGTVRFINNDVNIGERQSISGSSAVRGGAAQLGVNDCSFHDLELGNDQGIVWLNNTGVGTTPEYVADVRNSVDFGPLAARAGSPATALANRIITDDPASLPANGAAYTAVFGMANPTAGLGNFRNNTISLNGNMSGIDNAYIQGKLRRFISFSGGSYGFPLGLEPSASATAARGVQYAAMQFSANNYDVIEGFFQNGSSNAALAVVECGYTLDCFYGAVHGEWIFNDINFANGGAYGMDIYPQDYANPACAPSSVFVITKDDVIAGTANSGCDTNPADGIGQRTGFNGFSEFGFVGGATPFAVEWISFDAHFIEEGVVQIDWATASESYNAGFEIQRSVDASIWESIGFVAAKGAGNYIFSDKNPHAGPSHYRLKQLDLDGQFQFSNIATVHILALKNQIQISPNPSSSTVSITINNPSQSSISAQLIDPLGRKIWSTKVTDRSTIWQKEFQFEQSGTYFLSVQVADQIIHKKILRY